MSIKNNMLQMKEGAGWNRGLDNLLQVEFGRWFHTRKWWIQIQTWIAFINLIMVLVVIDNESTDAPSLPMLFSIFVGVFAAIGVCVLTQSAIVGEKNSGTAAWVLSKPAARSAFITAKLVANLVGIAVTMILVPGVITYILSLVETGRVLHLLGYLGGMVVLVIYLLFYLSLTLMLGAIFKSRGPIIAIPLVFIFIQQLLLEVFPGSINVLPWTLAIPPNESTQLPVAAALMMGTEPISYLPIISVLVISTLFIAVALWLFERLEF